MLIVRSPLRISIAGGGTDIPSYYKKKCSYFISAAINKYVYVSITEPFDKGIYFNIPVFGNFINYSWRPLTKDPGAKLVRKNNLHDLLVKFRQIN